MFPQAPPLICNGNLATTLTSSEEDSRPGGDPAPAVTPDACRAPMTSLVSSLPPILTSLSLLTPGLAKGCFYGNNIHTRAQTIKNAQTQGLEP